MFEAAKGQLNILMKRLLERGKKRGQVTGQRENNSVGTEYTNRGRLQGDNNGSDGGVTKGGRSIGTGTAINIREVEEKDNCLRFHPPYPSIVGISIINIVVLNYVYHKYM